MEIEARKQNEKFKELEKKNNETRSIAILDSTIQQLSTKSSRLRKYQKYNIRKKQNKLFNTNQKFHYRSLRNNQKQEEEQPATGNIEQFWFSDQSQSLKHNNNAYWITTEENRMNDKPTMTPYKLTKEMANKKHNWKGPECDHIHNF